MGRSPKLNSKCKYWRPAGPICRLHSFFATFGVPESGIYSRDTENFLRLWEVQHCLSSVAFPQFNGRADVAVKIAKRHLKLNADPTGSLDHDRFLCAMLQLRNTPDLDCNLSPAQIIFGRPLWDTLSRFIINKLEKFPNPHIRLFGTRRAGSQRRDFSSKDLTLIPLKPWRPTPDVSALWPSGRGCSSRTSEVPIQRNGIDKGQL